MDSLLVLTISGPDRAGLVEELAEVIARFEGNWEHCRMAHLAGRFVGLLQVAVSSEKQQDLESALGCVEGLDVLIAAGESSLSPPKLEGSCSIELVGSDHPGIVRDVFRALAATGVNVEKLSSRTFTARDSGTILFEAKAELTCSSDLDLQELRGRVEAIAQDIMVEIHFSEMPN